MALSLLTWRGSGNSTDSAPTIHQGAPLLPYLRPKSKFQRSRVRKSVKSWAGIPKIPGTPKLQSSFIINYLEKSAKDFKNPFKNQNKLGKIYKNIQNLLKLKESLTKILVSPQGHHEKDSLRTTRNTPCSGRSTPFYGGLHDGASHQACYQTQNGTQGAE